MTDIQSATAEIRRGKKEEARRNHWRSADLPAAQRLLRNFRSLPPPPWLRRRDSTRVTIARSASVRLVMAVLWNRTGHYIFVLWFFLLHLSSISFPRLISAVADWMSIILPHMVWP